MFLKIHSLKLENIRCFTEEEFRFKEGVNVITGANGSGKSTIITSIGFGLYGNDYLKGSGLNLADMIKRGEEGGKITLNFSTAEGNFTSDYRIKITGSDIWKLYQRGASQPIAEGITETRSVIQTLLGDKIDHQTFKTALCSRQGELTKLLDDSPKERSDQIKSILGLDNFGKAEAALHDYSKQKEEEKRQLENQIEIHDNMKIDMEELKGNITENKKNLEFAKNKKQELDQEITTLKASVEELTKLSEKLNHLQNDIKQLKNDKNQKNNEFKSLKSEVDRFEEQLEIDGLTSEKAQNFLQELNTKLNQFSMAKQTVQQKLDTFSNTTEEISKLQQEVIEHNKTIEDNLERKKELSKEGTIEELENEQSNKKSIIDNYDKNLNQLKERKNEVTETIHNLRKTKQKLENTIQQKKQKFKELFSDDIENIEKIKSEISENKSKIEKEINEAEEKLNSIQEEIGTLEGKIQSVNKTINLISDQDLHQDCPVCQRSLEGLDKSELISIQSEIKNKLLKEMEEKQNIRRNLQKEKKELDNSFETLRVKKLKLQNFNEEVPQIHKNEQEIEELKVEIQTTGEKQKTLEGEFEELKETDPVKLRERIVKIQDFLKELRAINQELKTVKALQESKSNQINDLKEKIKDISKTDLLDKKNKITKKIEELEETTILLSRSVLPQLQKISKVKTSLDQITKDLDVKVREYEKSNQNFNKEEFENLKNLRDRKIGASGSYKTEIENYTKKKKELQDEFEKAQKQKDKRKELQEKLDELNSVLPLASTLKNILQDAPERLIAKTSSQISNYLSKMIKRLLPDQGFNQAKFEQDGDIIIFNDGKAVDKKTLSGGERTILALTLRMALADYVAPLQFLTLDEPTNHLDANRVNEFIEIIDREELFSQSKGQLLLVTHREEFNRNAQNSIILDFQNGKRELVTPEDLE